MDSHVLAAHFGTIRSGTAWFGATKVCVNKIVITSTEAGMFLWSAPAVGSWPARRKSKGLRKHLRRTKAARKAER